MGSNSTAARDGMSSGWRDVNVKSKNSNFGRRLADLRNSKSPASPAPDPAPAQRAGLYDPKTKSNFEEEIKKRKKNPTGGTMGGTGGGGYGGSTILG